MDLVPRETHVFAVGRLDCDTTGLLILTNDGELANEITSPGRKIMKTYEVTVNGKVSEGHLKKLLGGVEITDGVSVHADKCVIDFADSLKTKLTVTIHEGKNRQIKRMFDAIGKKVFNLHRSAIGNLKLDLPEGTWRELSQEEVRLILE